MHKSSLWFQVLEPATIIIFLVLAVVTVFKKSFESVAIAWYKETVVFRLSLYPHPIDMGGDVCDGKETLDQMCRCKCSRCGEYLF